MDAKKSGRLAFTGSILLGVLSTGAWVALPSLLEVSVRGIGYGQEK